MIYQKKGVTRQPKDVIWQQQGVMLVVIYSKKCDMSGNLTPAGLDLLAAIRWKPDSGGFGRAGGYQHHQHICTEFGGGFCTGIARVWSLRQFNMKVQEKKMEVIHSSRNPCIAVTQDSRWLPHGRGPVSEWDSEED